MTTLAIQKIIWDALAPEQVEGLRLSADLPRLGEPATYTDDSNTEWCIFDDSRITESQVATVAALVENPELIPLPVVPDEEEGQPNE